MKEIPQHIAEEMKVKAATFESHTPHDGLGPSIYEEGFTDCYSLASSELERLKGLLYVNYINHNPGDEQGWKRYCITNQI